MKNKVSLLPRFSKKYLDSSRIEVDESCRWQLAVFHSSFTDPPKIEDTGKVIYPVTFKPCQNKALPIPTEESLLLVELSRCRFPEEETGENTTEPGKRIRSRGPLNATAT